MREFTDQDGDQLLAFIRRVLYELPDIMPAGEKGYVNFLPAKISVLVEGLRYGIGQHAKHAPESDRRPLIVQPKYPIGTDPLVMRRLEEEALDRAAARGPRAVPARDRPAIFSKALVKAVGHKDAPQEVRDALKTEDGDELQPAEPSA